MFQAHRGNLPLHECDVSHVSNMCRVSLIHIGHTEVIRH